MSLGDEHRGQALGSSSGFDLWLRHVAFGDIWTFLPETSAECASVSETGFLHVAKGEDHAEGHFQTAG